MPRHFRVTVICDDDPRVECKDFILNDSEIFEISSCEEQVSFCVEISPKDLDIYSIDQNGSFYTGSIDKCDTNAESIMLFAKVGKHTFTFTNELTGCMDEINIKVVCEKFVTDGSKTPNPNNNLTVTKEVVRSEGSPLIGKIAPEADEDEINTMMNKPSVIDVISNDRAVNQIRSLNVVEAPKHGTLHLNADNTFTYEPNEDFCNPQEPDFFRYAICNDYACDTAAVKIIINCEPIEVFSGFSPNGDGINDYLRIEGLSAYPNHELKVFNRWGKLLFSQKGYDGKWDGKYHGEGLPDGTYFYLLDDGKGKQHSGFLQINR